MLLSPCVVQAGVVDAAVRTTALAARKCAARHRFGDGQHAVQVPGEVPSWVEEARAFNADAGCAGFQLIEFRQGSTQVLLVAKDADKALHDAL